MGHELGQILLALHLEHPHDAATVYYRSRPFVPGSGLTAREALAAGMARTGSPSKGRDVGVTYSLPRRSGATCLPVSGDVGAQYTPAAGWAQAIGYHSRVLGDETWQGAIAVAQGGEGSIAANGSWAALNMATVLDLPMLFSIEDNKYGLSVPGDCQTPGGNIAANLACYGNLRTLNGDGVDPATEQINDIGTLRWRTAGKFASPVVLRIPVGYGKKTGDPWHSVSGEAVFAHTLGWPIAYPSNAEDAVGLLRTALRSDDPTLFLEHRDLLDTAPARRPYPGDDYCLPFGLAATIAEGDELTVITWGESVARC